MMNDKDMMMELQEACKKRIIYLINEYCDGSQQVFADKVKIGKTSVSQYVNGQNLPTNKRAGQIAQIFSVSPAWVMGFDVPMNKPATELEAEPDAAFLARYKRLTKRDRAVIDQMVSSLLQSENVLDDVIE